MSDDVMATQILDFGVVELTTNPHSNGWLWRMQGSNASWSALGYKTQNAACAAARRYSELPDAIIDWVQPVANTDD